jgi:putrescine importer
MKGEQGGEQSATDMASGPRLGRVLGLWDLVFYGVIIIQPIAAVPIFGVTEHLSGGHAVTAVLIAGMAMMLTAVSYGRMAALYPLAGSAYNYVGRGLNPHLGFLAGWAMVLDYLVFPVVCVIQAALTMQRLLPVVPYGGWVAIFVVLLTGINLRGIRSTARTNIVLLASMSVVITVFVIAAVRYLTVREGIPGLLSTQPFVSPGALDVRALATATAFAALTYLGFDGITTLAEDVKNPRRNVLLATVLVCAFTTLFSGLLVYLAQLAWPDYRSFPDMDTAFMDVTHRVGGPLLFEAMGIVIMLGSLGAGLSSEVAAARLLYAMGRDDVIPRTFFGYLSPRTNTPVFNVLLISALTLVGCMVLNLEHAGELLNFGAFLSFMGVNLASLSQYYLRPAPGSSRRLLRDALVPALGFLICFGMWLSLPRLAQIVGGIWFSVGVIYQAIRTRGFRTPPVILSFPEP